MRIVLTALASLLALASAAQATDFSKGDVVLHAGQFSALRDSKREAFEGGAEYRVADVYHGLRPTVGVLANDDSATYTYAGINWDLPVPHTPIVITPGFDAGYYNQGDSKHLGYALEFRSSLEATYKFKDGQRIGAAISHLSNAGLGNNNPGTETLQVVYSHPISF